MDLTKINNEIQSNFEIYLVDFLDTKKYYYWTLNYFKSVAGLSFQYYFLADAIKKEINLKGENYFAESKINFSINKNSHRNDLTIKNIITFFEDHKEDGQTKRYEYIKEYVLWQLLVQLNKEELNQKIELQKNNFLFTYLQYLTKNKAATRRPNFLAYSKTEFGKNLLLELNDLIKEKENPNQELQNKVEKLFISKEYDERIHFVFTKTGKEDKEELRELLDVLSKGSVNNYYRGQADATWLLDSSLTREEKYEENEARMYYDILSLKPEAFANDHNIYDRLITMQHFGMPTRLLDITRNPLVSIFFACNNLERANADGLVYAFVPNATNFLTFDDERLKCLTNSIVSQNKDIHKINCDLSPSEKEDCFKQNWFVQGIAKNQRINNQSGHFVFVSSQESRKELNSLPTKIVIIDANSKKVLLEQLESLNIHSGSVYPDLSHMSSYIRERYKDETYIASISHRPIPTSIDSKSTVKKSEDTTPKVLSTKFDETTFWTKERNSKLKVFVKEEKLKSVELKSVINTYLFDEKPPLPDSVISTLKSKPSLKNRRTIAEETTKKIIEFAKSLNN
ncbi:FRG domain-containing protein [Flavicella sp.]|uniref:FRG domain-containing protein n=1 Tax=Flavicella sp. TaxID=2957742 RepID=UPI00301AA5E3